MKVMSTEVVLLLLVLIICAVSVRSSGVGTWGSENDNGHPRLLKGATTVGLKKTDRKEYLNKCDRFTYDVHVVAQRHIFLFVQPVEVDTATEAGCMPIVIESWSWGSDRLSKRMLALTSPLEEGKEKELEIDWLYLGSHDLKSIFRAFDKASPNDKGLKKYNFVTNNCFHFIAHVMKRINATITKKQSEQIVRGYSKKKEDAKWFKRQVVQSGANTLKFLRIANPKRVKSSEVARAMVEYQFDKYKFIVGT